MRRRRFTYPPAIRRRLWNALFGQQVAQQPRPLVTLPAEEGSELPSADTFLVANIRGFTRFTVARGNNASAELATRFAEVSRSALGRNGAQIFDQRPDAAFAIFSSASEAARAAADLAEACRGTGSPATSMLARIGIGLAAGSAVRLEQGYVGLVPKVAEALSEVANLGTVLLTEETYKAAGRVDDHYYVDRGCITFDYSDEPVHVVELVPDGFSPTDFVTDYGTVP